MRRNETLPFAATWAEQEGIKLSEISQRKTDTVCSRSYVDLEKLDRSPWGRGRGKIVTEREGGKPQETLKYREQTKGVWGWRRRKMGDGH